MSALWVKQLKRLLLNNSRTVQTRRASKPHGKTQSRLQIESLEDRIVLNTYTVTTTLDNGAGSLRQGLLGSYSVIDFNIPTSDAGYNTATHVWTINIASQLPQVTTAVTIDGTSQGGSSGYASQGHPVIEINGAGAGNSDGLDISATGASVLGLAITGFSGNGINVTGTNNVIADDYIGVNPAGNTAQPNGTGILVSQGATGNTIGGTSATAGNLISGNTNAGVQIDGSSTTGNVVQNNRIGISSSSSGVAIPNGIDIEVSGQAANNPILSNTQLSTGSWTELSTNAIGLSNMIELPNGNIMIHAFDPTTGGLSGVWYQLSPDDYGGYLDGTLSTLAPMSTPREYFGSVVLPDDDLLVYGGEYSGNSPTGTYINSGEIYDPSSNSWTPVPKIPASLDPTNDFGDEPMESLPNGDILAGYIDGPQTFIYDPSTQTWSAGPTKLGTLQPGVSAFFGGGITAESSDEESWVKLPGTSGDVLDYELWASLSTQSPPPPGFAEYLDTTTNQWVATGSVPVPLSNLYETELGPALLLPSTGNVFQIGANGQVGGSKTNTAIYNPTTNTWSAGPTIPNNMTADDAPGAVLPDGNVVFDADSSHNESQGTSGQYAAPTDLYEFNGTSIGQMTLPPAMQAEFSDPQDPVSSFTTQMLDLPSGQLAFVDSTGNMWLYNEPEAVNPAWAPTISSISTTGPNTYTLTGTQLTGMDEGAAYGDDATMAENYPIIQLTNPTTGNVYDATSFNWSSTGVQTGNAPVSTEFSLPQTVPLGSYLLTVDTNGISSSPVAVNYSSGGLSLAPLITSISPNTGATAGGTTVTIDGSGLSNATAVDFGANPATILSDTDSEIVVSSPASSPAGASKTVSITVTNSLGTSGLSSADQFTYIAPPSITSLTPNSGTVLGGSTVTIKGSNLEDATTVKFGTKSATIVSDSNNQLVVTTPAETVGTVNVIVTTAYGTSTVTSGGVYTYEVLPTIQSISPNSGTAVGGTTVTITGTDLASATAVDFGANAAKIISDTASQIVVVSPAGTPGVVDITITGVAITGQNTNTTGTSPISSADQFTYLIFPVVSSISGNMGPAIGDTDVTITGTYLNGATGVDFGSTPATILSDTATQIVVLSPAGTAGKTVDVTVTNVNGTSGTLAGDLFTYVGLPTVTGITPDTGPIAGGTAVTIMGTNFTNAATVAFGSQSVKFKVMSSNEITATSPAGSNGIVDVVVSNIAGPSATSLEDQFNYQAPACPSTSTVSVTSSTDPLDTPITVIFQAEDAQGNDLTTGGQSVNFILGSPAGGQGTFGPIIDDGDGIYTATFTGSTLGSNTIKAILNGTTVTTPAPSIVVTPGIPDTSTSVLTLSSSSVKAGGSLTVTLQPKDVANNKVNSNSLQVSFGLGNGIGQGTFSNGGIATYNKNGTYTATFTGNVTGTNTIIAYIGGTALTVTPSISVSPGAANLSQSTLSVVSGTVASGASTTVTLQAVDGYGNPETTGGLSVAFKLASSTGAKGTFSAVKDNKNGTYTATFTGTIAGTNTILATIGGSKVTSTLPSITVTPGSVSLSKSVVTLSSSSVQTGGTITVTLEIKDAAGNIITNSQTVQFLLGTGVGGGTFGTITDNSGIYTTTFKGSSIGKNTILASIGGSDIAIGPSINVIA